MSLAPEEDEDAPRQPALFAAFARYKRVIVPAAAVWFVGVVAGGIFLSQLDARNGLHVFGPERFVAGEPAVLRVALKELQFQRFEDLGVVEVSFTGPSGEATEPQLLSAHAGPFVQGAVLAPVRAGAYELVLATNTPQARLSATMDIHVSPKAEPVPLPPAPKKRPPSRDDVGPLKLDIGPTSHVLPGGGLPSSLTVHVTDAAGAPVSTEVELTMKDGRSAVPVPTKVFTDRHGLATVRVEAMHPTFWFELASGESRAMRRFSYTPTQFALTLPKSVVKPGERMQATVYSLHREGHAFLDLWHGDRWLQTWPVELSAGSGNVEITFPETASEDPAVMWLQAYRTAYLPQKARGGRHVLVTAGDAGAAARWLAGRLAEHGVEPAAMRALAQRADASPTLGTWLLGRTERPDRDPPLLADSSVTARQTVDTMKSQWQRRFVIALLASALLLFGILAWLVAYNYRDVSRRWAAAGGDVDGELGTRRRVLVDAGYIFLVLAVFLLGMIQLLLTIRW